MTAEEEYLTTSYRNIAADMTYVNLLFYVPSFFFSHYMNRATNIFNLRMNYD